MTPGDPQQSLARLEALAKLMDGAFVIPGTSIRMGLDGIIGLIPGIGDAVSGRDFASRSGTRNRKAP